jgi:hypothetical protein
VFSNDAGLAWYGLITLDLALSARIASLVLSRLALAAKDLVDV